jgi:hypothetical protein
MFWHWLNIIHLFAVFGIGYIAEKGGTDSWISNNQNGALMMAGWCAVGVFTRIMADKEAQEGFSFFWLLGLIFSGAFFLYYGITGALPGS